MRWFSLVLMMSFAVFLARFDDRANAGAKKEPDKTEKKEGKQTYLTYRASLRHRHREARRLALHAGDTPFRLAQRPGGQREGDGRSGIS